MLNFDDSVRHIKVNYREEYPVGQKNRATFGNIPYNLHAEITEVAKAKGLQIPMTIAALLDFYLEHETENAEALDKLRAKNKGKRA